MIDSHLGREVRPLINTTTTLATSSREREKRCQPAFFGVVTFHIRQLPIIFLFHLCVPVRETDEGKTNYPRLRAPSIRHARQFHREV